MSRIPFLKPLLVTAVVALLLVGALSWIMGKNFIPWVTTAKLNVRAQLEQLVSNSKYELAKAEHAVAQARQRVGQIRKASAEASAGIRQLESERRLADKEMQIAKAQVALIGERLEGGQEVRLASGRTLSTEEIRLRVQDQGQRIELAQQKLSLLDDVLKRRHERKQKLDEMCRQAPLELGRLELSVRHLSDKIALYETQRKLCQEEQEAGESLAGLFEQAQKTLEVAHADLDTKLAEFDATFGSSLEAARPLAANDNVQSQEILKDIRKLLGTDRVAAK